MSKRSIQAAKAFGVKSEGSYPLHLAFNDKGKAQALIDNWEEEGGFAKGELKAVKVIIITAKDWKRLKKLVGDAIKLEAD